MRTRMLVALGLLGLPTLPVDAAAQLGGRPAQDWAPTLESGRRLEGLDIENVIDALELRPTDVVADVGAGTGIFTVPLAQAVGPGGTVLAVEVDAGFLPMIQEKARTSGVSNVQTVLGAYEDPKLPRRDVTVAFFHDVLHHIEDRQGYLRALAGYMAPGSRIAVVDYDAGHPSSPHQDQPEMLISPEQVEGWMRDAGFELTDEIELFEEKFFSIYTKAR